jgi:hypothetical protein
MHMIAQGVLTCLLVQLNLSGTGAASGLVMVMVELVLLKQGHSITSWPMAAGALLLSFSS